MGKVSKLFNGELKKIFLGPGIFFMTAFLILVLTIAPKFFSPTKKSDISTTTTISTTDVKEAYNSFLEYKSEYQIKLNKISEDVNALIDNNANFKQNLVSLVDNDDVNNYGLLDLSIQFAGLTVGNDVNSMLSCLDKMVNKTTELQALYDSYLQNYVFPVILVDEDLDFDIRFEISQLLKILTKDGTKTDKLFYKDIQENLYNSNIVVRIKDFIYKIKNLSYSSDNLKTLVTDYSISTKDEYKNEINTTMTEMLYNANSHESPSDDEYKKQEERTRADLYNKDAVNIDKMVDLSYKYLSVDDNIYKIIENSLFIEVSSDYSDSEISNYIGFNDFNSYSFEESLTKYKYLLENDLSDCDVANMFSFNTASSTQDNAFDYMYFTMEIASILIIAFTVILGAGMIAKEYSEGTIKLLVMRPFNRNKIILAKILATMFLAFIFVMVSTIITLITGCIVYGISFPSVLVVFNASTAFTLPIWLVFIIYLTCLMIKIWIFALLAIAISTIFKSYIAAVCISAGIYILNIILTFVSNGANWLKYNIFANLDIFKYFGGSFGTRVTENQNLTNLFASPVFADTTVWLSVIIIGCLALVLHLILFTVFKHRDIT